MICYIDGIIGAGKSTVLEILRRRGYVVIMEDVDRWGVELSEYYNDPCDRTAFALDRAVRRSRSEIMDIVKYKHPDTIVFIERSPVSNDIFSRLRHELGFLTEEHYDKLLTTTPIESNVSDDEQITIRLNVSLTTAMKRIAERGRMSEDNICMYYLFRLNELYDDRFRQRYQTVDCDGTLPPEDIADHVLSIVRLRLENCLR